MTVMELELISFKLCPFVQRAVITLRHKRSPYKIRYVDLADPPQWFRALSPAGKVPLLVVDNQHVLFESAVINEFIDDVTPGRMHPADPLQRALHRSWIEFGSRCLWATREMTTAEDEAAFRQVVTSLEEQLAQLEAVLGAGPYFDDTGFSLVDAAYAPLFMRLALLGRHATVYNAARLPSVARWSAALLALPEVSGSVVADFPDLLDALIRRCQGYLAKADLFSPYRTGATG